MARNFRGKQEYSAGNPIMGGWRRPEHLGELQFVAGEGVQFPHEKAGSVGELAGVFGSERGLAGTGKRMATAE